MNIEKSKPRLLRSQPLSVSRESRPILPPAPSRLVGAYDLCDKIGSAHPEYNMHLNIYIYILYNNIYISYDIYIYHMIYIIYEFKIIYI